MGLKTFKRPRRVDCKAMWLSNVIMMMIDEVQIANF